MKLFWWLLGIFALLMVGYFLFNSFDTSGEPSDTSDDTSATSTDETGDSTSSVEVTPVSHATAILNWGDSVIYTDPTGGADAFEGMPPADIILITDIHSDHLSTGTLSAVASSAALIVPQAVRDLLPEDLASRSQVLANGATATVEGFTIVGVPMYNLPESTSSQHTKGRGNGYVIEKDGTRVYVAGDTSGTPEMRALTDIDIAFIPMNLPFTMGVEEAADAVLAFAPKQVYPYHYREQEGLSNTEQFKQLVNAGNPDIDVVLLDWYPEL